MKRYSIYIQYINTENKLQYATQNIPQIFYYMNEQIYYKYIKLFQL